jgi:transcriptional regulator with XRE-family HTH domain
MAVLWQKQPLEVMQSMALRAKAMRKAQGLSQQALATRSGVSFGSLQRFEQSGQISLESLLRIAFALEAIAPFEALFPIDNQPQRLEDLFK